MSVSKKTSARKDKSLPTRKNNVITKYTIPTSPGRIFNLKHRKEHRNDISYTYTNKVRSALESFSDLTPDVIVISDSEDEDQDSSTRATEQNKAPTSTVRSSKKTFVAHRCRDLIARSSNIGIAPQVKKDRQLSPQIQISNSHPSGSPKYPTSLKGAQATPTGSFSKEKSVFSRYEMSLTGSASPSRTSLFRPSRNPPVLNPNLKSSSTVRLKSAPVAHSTPKASAKVFSTTRSKQKGTSVPCPVSSTTDSKNIMDKYAKMLEDQKSIIPHRFQEKKGSSKLFQSTPHKDKAGISYPRLVDTKDAQEEEKKPSPPQPKKDKNENLIPPSYQRLRNLSGRRKLREAPRIQSSDAGRPSPSKRNSHMTAEDKMIKKWLDEGGITATDRNTRTPEKDKKKDVITSDVVTSASSGKAGPGRPRKRKADSPKQPNFSSNHTTSGSSRVVGPSRAEQAKSPSPSKNSSGHKSLSKRSTMDRVIDDFATELTSHTRKSGKVFTDVSNNATKPDTKSKKPRSSSSHSTQSSPTFFPKRLAKNSSSDTSSLTGMFKNPSSQETSKQQSSDAENDPSGNDKNDSGHLPASVTSASTNQDEKLNSSAKNDTQPQNATSEHLTSIETQGVMMFDSSSPQNDVANSPVLVAASRRHENSRISTSANSQSSIAPSPILTSVSRNAFGAVFPARKRPAEENFDEVFTSKRAKNFLVVERDEKKRNTALDCMLSETKKKTKEKRMASLGSPVTRRALFANSPPGPIVHRSDNKHTSANSSMNYILEIPKPVAEDEGAPTEDKSEQARHISKLNDEKVPASKPPILTQPSLPIKAENKQGLERRSEEPSVKASTASVSLQVKSETGPPSGKVSLGSKFKLLQSKFNESVGCDDDNAGPITSRTRSNVKSHRFSLVSEEAKNLSVTLQRKHAADPSSPQRKLVTLSPGKIIATVAVANKTTKKNNLSGFLKDMSSENHPKSSESDTVVSQRSEEPHPVAKVTPAVSVTSVAKPTSDSTVTTTRSVASQSSEKMDIIATTTESTSVTAQSKNANDTKTATTGFLKSQGGEKPHIVSKVIASVTITSQSSRKTAEARKVSDSTEVSFAGISGSSLKKYLPSRGTKAQISEMIDLTFSDDDDEDSKAPSDKVGRQSETRRDVTAYQETRQGQLDKEAESSRILSSVTETNPSAKPPVKVVSPVDHEEAETLESGRDQKTDATYKAQSDNQNRVSQNLNVPDTHGEDSVRKLEKNKSPGDDCSSSRLCSEEEGKQTSVRNESKTKTEADRGDFGDKVSSEEAPKQEATEKSGRIEIPVTNQQENLDTAEDQTVIESNHSTTVTKSSEEENLPREVASPSAIDSIERDNLKVGSEEAKSALKKGISESVEGDPVVTPDTGRTDADIFGPLNFDFHTPDTLNLSAASHIATNQDLDAVDPGDATESEGMECAPESTKVSFNVSSSPQISNDLCHNENDLVSQKGDNSVAEKHMLDLADQNAKDGIDEDSNTKETQSGTTQGSKLDDTKKSDSSMFDISQFFDDDEDDFMPDQLSDTEIEMNDYLPEILCEDTISALRQNPPRGEDDSEDRMEEGLLDELPDLTETPRSKRRTFSNQNSGQKTHSRKDSLAQSEQMMSRLLERTFTTKQSSTQESIMDADWMRELDEIVSVDPNRPRNPRKRLRSTDHPLSLKSEPSFTAILADTAFSRSYKIHGASLKKLVREKKRDNEVDKMEKILLSDLKKGGFRRTLEQAEKGCQGSNIECDEDTKRAINLMKKDWGTLPILSSSAKIFTSQKVKFCIHEMDLKSYFCDKSLESLSPKIRTMVMKLTASDVQTQSGYFNFLLNHGNTRIQTYKFLLDVLLCLPRCDTVQQIIQSNLRSRRFTQSPFSFTQFKSALINLGVSSTVFNDKRPHQKTCEESPKHSVCEKCVSRRVKTSTRNMVSVSKILSTTCHIYPELLWTPNEQAENAVYMLMLLQERNLRQHDILEMIEIFLRELENWDSVKYLIICRLVELCSKLNVLQLIAMQLHFNGDRLHELSRILSFTVLKLHVFGIEPQAAKMDNYSDLEALVDIVDHFNPENLELLLVPEKSEKQIGSQKRSFYHLSLLLPMLNICIGDKCEDNATFAILDRIWSILRTMNKRIRDNGAIYRSQVKYELSLFTKNLRILIQKAPKANKASIFKYLRSAPVKEEIVDTSVGRLDSSSESSDEADVAYNDDDDEDEVKGRPTRPLSEIDDEFRIAEVIKSRIIGSAGKD